MSEIEQVLRRVIHDTTPELRYWGRRARRGGHGAWKTVAAAREHRCAAQIAFWQARLAALTGGRKP